DEGKALSVRVTASKLGYRSATTTSLAQTVAEREPGLRGFDAAPAPTLAAAGGGAIRVGVPATAAPGAWDPQPDAFAYHWERNGIRIPGADSASYTPQPADLGKHLAVWVTAAKAGYRTTMRVSAVEQVMP